MSKKCHKRLGEILCEMSVISQDQLDTALTEQQRRSDLLGVVLVDTGVITKQDIDNALVIQEMYNSGKELRALEYIRGVLSDKYQSLCLRVESLSLKLEDT